MRTSKLINIRYFVFWSRSLNLISSYTLCNCIVTFGKGGFISESFSLWLHPPENVPNHNPEHLLFWGLVGARSHDSDFALFLKDRNAFWYSATFKKQCPNLWGLWKALLLVRAGVLDDVAINCMFRHFLCNIFDGSRPDFPLLSKKWEED